MLLFAAIAMIVLGLLDALWGLAAIFNEGNVVVGGHGVLIGDVGTWGWVSLIGGSLVALTGFGLGLRLAAARWAAIVLVAANAVGSIVWFPAAPVWAFMVVGFDVLVINLLLVSWSDWVGTDTDRAHLETGDTS